MKIEHGLDIWDCQGILVKSVRYDHGIVSMWDSGSQCGASELRHQHRLGAHEKWKFSPHPKPTENDILGGGT